MEWPTTSIVYICFESFVGILSIIGNSIVFSVIIRSPSLHSVTNVFIANLALADILVGLLVAPMAAISFLGLPKHSVYGCILVNSIILIFTNVSILMLVSVAVERFIAIRLPFLYNRLLTTKRAMVVNGCVWVAGSLLGCMPMYGWNIAPDDLNRCAFTDVISLEYMVYFQFCGVIIIPFIMMLGVYSYILYVIRKHTKRTDALQVHFRVAQRQWKRDVRAVKSLALLVLIFAFFWLPVNILNVITLAAEKPGLPFPYTLLLAAIVMSHANSSINPFIYAASNSRIQSKIKSLFGIKLNLSEMSGSEFRTHTVNSTETNSADRALSKSTTKSSTRTMETVYSNANPGNGFAHVLNDIISDGTASFSSSKSFSDVQPGTGTTIDPRSKSARGGKPHTNNNRPTFSDTRSSESSQRTVERANNNIGNGFSHELNDIIHDDGPPHSNSSSSAHPAALQEAGTDIDLQYKKARGEQPAAFSEPDMAFHHGKRRARFIDVQEDFSTSNRSRTDSPGYSPGNNIQKISVESRGDIPLPSMTSNKNLGQGHINVGFIGDLPEIDGIVPSSPTEIRETKFETGESQKNGSIHGGELNEKGNGLPVDEHNMTVYVSHDAKKEESVEEDKDTVLVDTDARDSQNSVSRYKSSQSNAMKKVYTETTGSQNCVLQEKSSPFNGMNGSLRLHVYETEDEPADEQQWNKIVIESKSNDVDGDYDEDHDVNVMENDQKGTCSTSSLSHSLFQAQRKGNDTFLADVEINSNYNTVSNEIEFTKL